MGPRTVGASAASGVARARTTTRAAGDFNVDGDPDVLTRRRREVVDLPWVWLRQVHSADVVVVTGQTGAAVAGQRADALVTAEAGLVLAVHTADCAPVVLRAERDRVIGVAHAGWRGLVAGVIEEAVGAMEALGAKAVTASVGPCIHRECYEFGIDDLAAVAARCGDSVRATTRDGRGALDLVEGVRVAVERAGATFCGADPSCTACEPARYFSHRARREPERMATVVWLEP